ncbi:MAG TPA: hypothetical protein VNM89_07920 [Solirubrobacterales bacterium]|nr:hypothetical protein [Solirubrobacterales bacterium]
MNEAPASNSTLVRRLRVAIAVLALLAAGLVLWAALGGEDDDSGESSPGQARVVSAAELGALAEDAPGPLYWAGERSGTELEYDEADGGRLYVRYLTEGAEAGDPRPVFLTIGTYPLADAVAALRANAKRTGSELLEAKGSGAVVWANPDSPTSVYLAEPGAAYQVEVYDPSPRRALTLALSGDVVPAP